MKNLPIDVNLIIFEFLDKKDLIPYNKISKVCSLMRCGKIILEKILIKTKVIINMKNINGKKG